MSLLAPQRAAASQARNPDRAYDEMFASDGVSVTSGAANTLGSFVALGTVGASNLCALDVGIGGGGSTSLRVQYQIKVNGVVMVPDYHINLSTNNFVVRRFWLQIPAGASLEIATRCSSATVTLRASAQGVIANALDSPGFASMTAISVDTAATRAGSSSAGLILPGDGTWKEFIASTSNVKGIMAVLAEHSTAPLTGQRVVVELGLGAADSEVPFWGDQRHVQISAPFILGANPEIITKNIPDGERLSARVVAPGGADSFRLGLWTFGS